MPIIQLDMLESRTTEQKHSLAKGLTDAAVQARCVNPQSVRILIHEFEPEHFAVACVTAGEKTLANGNGGAR